MANEGDTFWYHNCPHTDKKVYLPVGMKCPDCVLEAMSPTEKASVQMKEYLNEIEGTD
mgnify:FL=1|tara:strand:- start:441 stop:614 length:174 start_codon:yes stop_codon:yes gene_type:complete